jgi:hypothetical protein
LGVTLYSLHHKNIPCLINELLAAPCCFERHDCFPEDKMCLLCRPNANAPAPKSG